MTAAFNDDDQPGKDQNELAQLGDSEGGSDDNGESEQTGDDSGARNPGRPRLDPEMAEQIRQQLLAEQNFPVGLLAGGLTAVISALIWAGVTVATKFQIGYMAIGVGFLVGWSVRKLGRGRSQIFAFMAAACALFGCVLGNLLSNIAFVAINRGVPIADLVSALAAKPAIVVDLMVDTFSPIDLLFYGIAAYTGFQLGCDEIEQTEIYERFIERHSA